MNIENLAEYLLPLALLVFFFVLNFRKKKPEPKAAQPVSRPLPLSSREPLKKPSPARPQTQLSNIESRTFESAIEKQGTDLVSSALLKTAAAETAQKKRAISRAKKLLKGESLREAFLRNAILNRPYE